MSQAKQSTTVKQTNKIDAKQPAQTQQSPELLAMWEQPYWIRQQALQEPNVVNAAKVATLQRFVGNQWLGKSSYLARQPIHKPLTKQKVTGSGEEQQFTSNQQVIIQTQQSTAAQTSTTDDQQQSKQGYELGFFEKKLLSWAGVDPKVVMRLLSRAGGAVAHILKEPAKFINTVIRAIKQGFTQFKDKIGQHLQNGLVSWLFGSMSRAGIQLPKDFSPQSILSLVLQVLGITTDRLRQRVAKTIGEKNVQRIEKVWSVISTFVSQGIGGLWGMLKDYLGDLKETLLSEVKSWLITQIIQAAIGKILAMFNPVSGLFMAIKTIYNVVKFLIERASQIKALFQAVVDSVIALIQGDTQGAANKIELALARLIPVVIGFLASLLNIGGITDRIRGVIKRLQTRVDNAIDKIIGRLAKTIGLFDGKVIGKVKVGEKWLKSRITKGRDWIKEKSQQLKFWVTEKLEANFMVGDERHRVWTELSSNKLEIMVASNKKTLDAVIMEEEANIKNLPKERRGIATTSIAKLQSINVELKLASDELLRSDVSEKQRKKLERTRRNLQKQVNRTAELLKKLKSQNSLPLKFLPGDFNYKNVDNMGRARGASGWLAPWEGKRGEESLVSEPVNEQIRALKQKGINIDMTFDASHLIANQFGGDGIVRNLVPMVKRANTSYYGYFERIARNEVKVGNPVFIQTEVGYADSNPFVRLFDTAQLREIAARLNAKEKEALRKTLVKIPDYVMLRLQVPKLNGEFKDLVDPTGIDARQHLSLTFVDTEKKQKSEMKKLKSYKKNSQ